MRLSLSSESPSPYLDFTSVGVASGISSPIMFANIYRTRSDNSNTIFQGCDVSGVASNNFQFSRYEYANTQLVYSCVIKNTGRNILGNLIDTTVSDEKLKYDIDDFNEECSECIKIAKIKTFKYKDETYKDNDQYGMVAQQLSENLPQAMKGIVKENKNRDTDETSLSINCMTTSLILWKALQETLMKVEHLESSVYELREEMKELKKQKFMPDWSILPFSTSFAVVNPRTPNRGAA